MKKRELLARIEALETRVLLLEAQRFQPQPIFPLWPTYPDYPYDPRSLGPTWTQPSTGTPLPLRGQTTCEGKFS